MAKNIKTSLSVIRHSTIDIFDMCLFLAFSREATRMPKARACKIMSFQCEIGKISVDSQ